MDRKERGRGASGGWSKENAGKKFVAEKNRVRRKNSETKIVQDET